MKKMIFAGIFVLLFSVLTSNCFAAPYLSGNIGFVSVEDASVTDPNLSALGLMGVKFSLDSSAVFSLAAGSEIADGIRIEAEFSYRNNDIDSISASDGFTSASIPVNGEIKAISLMANLIKDINTNSIITPFLGLGIGFSKIDAELEGDSEDDTVFAYQAIVGAGFKVNETTSIDVSYRYFATTDPDLDGTKIDYATHNFMAGVRFSF
jgi:OmpA-OmpF porin, OOP family